jgi:hypothetical protein
MRPTLRYPLRRNIDVKREKPVNNCQFALGFESANLSGSADARGWGPRFFSRKSCPDVWGRYACFRR